MKLLPGVFIVFLALSLPRATFAQSKIYEEPIGWRGKRVELHTISSRDKQQNCVFVMNTDSIRLFVLDSAAGVIRQFGLRRDLMEGLLGGFIKGGKIYIFLHIEHGEPHMHGWTFDIATGTQEEYYVPFALKHEQLVDRISCGDHFLCMAVNKKESQFVLYDYRDGQHCDSLHYQFEGGIWKKLTKSARFGRDINVAKFDQEGESSAENAQTPNKIYLEQDTLFLVMNVDLGITGIFRFDLAGRQMSYRTIAHNKISEQEPPPEDYADNAYLLDRRLYFVSVVPDSLTVEIRDFDNGALLHQYMVGKYEEISFGNNAIIQTGSPYSKKSKREPMETSQLIRKMLDGAPVIMATAEDSGRIALSVGSYVRIVTSDVPGGSWMKGAGGSMTFVPSGGFYRNVWTKSARIRMWIDANTLKPVSGDMPLSLNEKVEGYTLDMATPQGENLFSNNGKTVYAYYNLDERKLVLVRF